jgi:hypothetical protein
MPVDKYKPRAIPHLLEERQARNFDESGKALQAGRDAVARSRRLVEDSHKVIERARALRRSKLAS